MRAIALLTVLIIPVAHASTFFFSSQPTQCASITLSWTGSPSSTSPYHLLLVPVGHLQAQEIRTIYDQSYTSGNSTTFTFPFPSGSQFVAVMSEGSNFGSIGTSDVITVQGSSDSSCLSTTPTVPKFYFYLSPASLVQCGTVQLSWKNLTEPPVRIFGVIPRGQSFNIAAPSDSEPFSWTVNIRAGTKVLFVAGDKHGYGTGGSTDLLPVLSSGSSSSCISNTSPSTTPSNGNDPGSVSPTAVPSGGGSSPNGGSGSGSGGGSNGGGGSGSGGSGGGGSGSGGSGSGGSGSGSGSGDGGDNPGGNGGGDGGDGGSDGPPGSGGGTVTGGAFGTNTIPETSSGSAVNLGTVLGSIVGVAGFLAILGVGLYYFITRRGNQNDRKRPVSHASAQYHPGYSDTNLLRPHLWPPRPRDQFTEARESVESLTTYYRTEPFILPRPGLLERASSTASRYFQGLSPMGPGYTQVSGEEVPTSRRLGPLGAVAEGDGSTPSSGLNSSSRPSNNTSHSTKSSLPTSHFTPPIQPQQPTAGASTSRLTRPPLAPRIATDRSAGDVSMYDIPPTYTSLRRRSSSRE